MYLLGYSLDNLSLMALAISTASLSMTRIVVLETSLVTRGRIAPVAAASSTTSRSKSQAHQ